MTESFLHYVWQHRRFNFLSARTIEGKQLNIKHPGLHNFDAGPDFSQAIIDIDNITWVGNVEIHIKSSDWYRHGHHNDRKYKSVILHVVYQADAEVYVEENVPLPTLELKTLIDEDLFLNYENLLKQTDLLSCRGCHEQVGKLIITSQMSSVLVERLLRRTSEYHQILKMCSFDWDEMIYRVIAKAFGCKTNSAAFEYLAQNLPYKIVFKHKDSLLQLDALMFGVAGFLEKSDGSEYVESLIEEYGYLQYKYALVPIELSCWNLLRLRPQNFPAVRIAQFSSMMHKISGNISNAVLSHDINALFQLFDITPDNYWRTHYRFGKVAQDHSVALGRQTVDSIFINTIIPIRFMFAKYTGNATMQENAMSMYESFPFENNKFTRICKGTLFDMKHAGDSQAIMEQLHNYCRSKRCLKCSIGEKIIRGSNTNTYF